jgi:divalent metal cation (Fe/Co/Zn/Cd) transporter
MTTTEPAEASLSSVPLVGVAVNAALASIKILAGFFGNSYALIADGIESTADIVTSLVVWGGLRVSVAPADEHHPYGYGKAEALSGIVASVALLAAAAMIAVQSVREILTPHHLPHWSTLLVLLLVVATKMVFARWMGGIGEEAESTSLQADAWHHWADALTSIAAFIGITIGLRWSRLRTGGRLGGAHCLRCDRVQRPEPAEDRGSRTLGCRPGQGIRAEGAGSGVGSRRGGGLGQMPNPQERDPVFRGTTC